MMGYQQKDLGHRAQCRSSARVWGHPPLGTWLGKGTSVGITLHHCEACSGQLQSSSLIWLLCNVVASIHKYEQQQWSLLASGGRCFLLLVLLASRWVMDRARR